LEWTTNATLQLHRLAQEELGCGTWEDGTDDVPTERTGAMMARLDMKDMKHPVLMKTAFEDEKNVHEIWEERGGSEIEMISTASTMKRASGVHVENVDNDSSRGRESLTIESLSDSSRESPTRSPQ
jgi:hypothetical protein